MEKKQQAIERFIEFRGGAQNIRFHTDKHVIDEPETRDVAEGCGHFKLSKKHPEEYGLNKEDVESISKKLEELLGDERQAKREVLDGKHREGAVIIITHEKLALRHQTEPGQAFIYNKALHHKLLKDLAADLSPALSLSWEDLEEALMEVAQKQTFATVKALAAGRKVFEVGLDDEDEITTKEVAQL